MDRKRDVEVSQRYVRPPLLMLGMIVAGWGLDWLWPLPFLPTGWVNEWIGAIVFVCGFIPLGLAAREFWRVGTSVPTDRPTTAIAQGGIYRFSRNPIYLAMGFAFAGLAIALDTLWIALAAVPFYAVIRYYVIAKEEAYLERRFGDEYRAYKARVRRWL